MYWHMFGIDVVKSAVEFIVLGGIFHYYVGANWQQSGIAAVEGLASNIIADLLILPHAPDSLRELASSGADVGAAFVFAVIRSSLHDFMFSVGGFIRAFLLMFIANMTGYYVSGIVAGTDPVSKLAFDNQKVKVISGGKTPDQQKSVINKKAPAKLF